MNFWMGKAQSKNVSAYDGAIFLCNHLTRKECFDRKIFGLSSKCTDFIHRVKSGATLFLYDVDQHKLHGVFEATSDGAMNIIPDAYTSSGFQYPCQIRFKRIWFCKPLMECEFEDAVQDNYFTRNKFTYGLSHQQVVKLLHLFSSRNRLQPRQYPRLQDEQPRESELSSVINRNDNQSGSNSSSHGSQKSPCQTCTSSTVGDIAASPSHKLAKPMSVMHGELQLDISDVAKSNSSRSSLHTAANADIVTDSGTQEAMDDKSTDDYIPLQLEEDTIDSVDYLSDLLGDESYSSESKDSSDSEEHTTFHQPSHRKNDYCDQPMANSKLRADIEGRKSVFARLLGKPKSFIQKEKSKTNPSMNAKSFSSLSYSRRKKRRRAQQNKPLPCDKRATFNMPLADKVRRIPAQNYSFFWDDDRSNRLTGGPSNIQIGQRPHLREDVNRWDVSTKEHDRYDASRRLFVPEGSKQLAESPDRELKIPPVFSEVHDSCEVTVKEETKAPFSDSKRRSKDPNVEGGDQDFETEDVEEAARKKTRIASASNQQEEYQSETALIQDTKPIDTLIISHGDSKLSITLSSNDTSTQMARAYLETEVLLQGEHKMIQGCCKDVTGDKCMVLEDTGNAPNLSFSKKQTSLKSETSNEVASGNLETEASLQEKHNQSAGSCYGVVNTDTMLFLEKPETMDISTNDDEDCGSEMCLPSDGNTRHVASDHLAPEMPTQEKQTPNVKSCSQVVHCDEVLAPEEMFPKFDANCECNKSLSSDEASNHVEASHLDIHVSLQEKPCQTAPGCCEIVNADQGFCQENSVILETSPKYDRCPVKNSLSADGISGYVASVLYSSDASPDPDSPECHGDGANKNILLDGTLKMAATDHQEICKLPQDEPFHGLSGTLDTSTADKLLTPEDCGNVDSLPKLSFGNMQTIVETRLEVDFSNVETETSLQEKQNQSDRNCHEVVNADKMLHLENPETMDLSPNHDEDGILQMLDTDQGKQMSFCGDTSSALEYSGTVDTRTVDGDSEHKTSSYQKDAEATYSTTRSEDEGGTTNAMSLNRRRNSSPPYDQELIKAIPQPETRYQDLPSRHEAAHHENSDSTDPFTVFAEGSGSKSWIPTESTSTHLLVADLLGTSSESRTGFFDGLPSELAEMIMFGHDPGEEMEPH